ncbi:GAF domain-containing protein [Bradyrhizobium sp.]|uniref:GAF domain-containing protein n=1 Tax=Bradyrhizobium sp. TaxID=376 RepID=UPI00261E26FC|nr:GAF domain-containing protein [Bradyrhizobium sp.]
MTDTVAGDSQQVIADLKRRLEESIAQQAATADVLKVLSRSTFDLQTVLETLIRSAVELCKANRGSIFLREGEVFPLKAASSTTPEFLQYWAANPPRAGRGSATSRVIASGRVELIPDVLADPDMEMPAGSLVRIRAALGVPMLRNDEVEGVMVLTRPEPGPFTKGQIDLVQTFADQAMIAIENTRLFNETKEALERQTATADILKVIASSPSDVQPVFESIVRNAKSLIGGFSATVSRIAGDMLHLAAFTPTNTRADEALQASFPIPLAEFPPFQFVRAGETVQFADTEAEGVPVTNREVARLRGYRSMLFTPLMNNGKPIGMISVTRKEPGTFADHHVELLQTFADQAVIAIENTRLFDEVQAKTVDLQESLRHQTATSEVLKVISRSPGELDPVFKTILSNATTICDAQFGLLLLREDGGFRFASMFNLPPAFAETFSRNPVIYPPPIDPLGRLIETRQLVHVVDVKQEPAYLTGFPPIVELVELGGARTLLLVPMLKEKSLVGVIAIFRQNVHAFSVKQIDLVTSFGSQAVIAIENARLLSELRERTDDLSESLQQQTATADVLKVISRSVFDLQTVLDTLVESAYKLCGANLGLLYLRGNEAFECKAIAGVGVTEASRLFKGRPIRAGRGTAAERVILTGEVQCITDFYEDPEMDPRIREAIRNAGSSDSSIGQIRSTLAVPMMRDNAVIGVMVIGSAQTGSFPQRQIELLQTFADQAVIAIENVRLFDEVQAKTGDLEESLQQQTATADVLKVISRSPDNLKPVLDVIVETSRELCNARTAVIFLLRDGKFHDAAESSTKPEYIEAAIRANPISPDQKGSITARAAREKRTVHIPNSAEDPEAGLGGPLDSGGPRSLLSVPLMLDGRVIGGITLQHASLAPFTARQVEAVETFADQAVIAISNVNLFEQVQARTKELSLSLEDLRTAQDRLVQTEKLASLGQLTAGIAHEIKNPLNFVNNFSALSGELIDELNDLIQSATLDDKTREEIDELTNMLKGNLDKVVQHGKRADSIVKNMLLHSREGSGERRAADINAIVEESLNLAYHGARAEKSGFNIALQRDLDPSAGVVDLYPQEITRVFLNLISNGFYAANKRKEAGDEGFEPLLTATTKNLGSRVEIRIRDNGTGIPAEVKEKMFNPFFTTKPAGEGTGLGLSMSHDIIVKQHGGKIDVETEPGAFTEFIITLPRAAA